MLDIEKAKINFETSKIPWVELQRFFAAGKVLQVSEDLDLTEVALQMSQDQVAEIQSQIDSGEISVLADEKAKDLFDRQASVWSVVIKPYVLVQEIAD